MNKMKRAGIFLASISCLILLASQFVSAKVMWYSKQELTRMSDLVIEGEVIKIEPSGKIKDEFGLKGRVSYATLKTFQVIKGKPDAPIIIVEFVKFDDFVGGIMLEPDCQDAQFQVNEKGTAYLKKLQNGHYMPAAGWRQGFKCEIGDVSLGDTRYKCEKVKTVLA
jgi:hypothetical protein